LDLNLIHILGHHTLHLVIALIIFVTEPAHHHVVGINEIPSFPSIVQPGGVIINNLDERIKLAQEIGLGWGCEKTTRIKPGGEKKKMTHLSGQGVSALEPLAFLE
jgi:hypothetical protein